MMIIKSIDKDISEFLKQVNSASNNIVEGIRTSSKIYIDIPKQTAGLQMSYLNDNFKGIFKIEDWSFKLEDFLPYIRLLQEQKTVNLEEYGNFITSHGYAYGGSLVMQTDIEGGLIVGRMSLEGLILNVDFQIKENDGIIFPVFNGPSYN